MQELQDWEICRSILESLPTGVCVVDLQKRVVYWSEGAERITGYLRHEVVGRDCLSNVLPHCDKIKSQLCPAKCPLESAIHTAHRVEASGLFHHKSGQTINLRINAVPIRDAHGSIIGAVETFDDHYLPAYSEHREEILQLSGCVDEITGLANQAMMQSYLREALAAFSRLHEPFALLCLRAEGLDHFRSNFGRAAAAAMLRAVAQTLENALWKTDFFGRWSDDRFLVILNGCSHNGLQSVRGRLANMLDNEGIEWWGEVRSLHVSIGEATALLDDTVDLLLQRVEQSLEQHSPPPIPSAAGAIGRASGS